MKRTEKALPLVGKVRSNAEGVNAASRERAVFIAELLQQAETMSLNTDALADQNRETRDALSRAASTIQDTRKPVAEFSKALVVSQAQTKQIRHGTEELQDRLGSIRDAGRKIGTIATTTKMLALNAFIEAKRAGDAGAGFEVIAAEVRKLSGQVEEAIRTMNEAVEAVAKANSAIGQDAQSMSTSMKDAGESAESCAVSLEALSGGVGQEVEGAGRRIDQMTTLVGQLGTLTDAIRQIEANTHQAIAGSQENIDICEAIERVLKAPGEDANAA